MNARFASSLQNDMRPLAFQGMRAIDCYDQLREFLRSNERFLSEHGMTGAGQFLAEPMADARTGCIDWYAGTAETPVPLSALPPEKRAEAEKAMAGAGAALRALIDRQRDEDARAGRTSSASAMLGLAVQHPSADDVYFADGHPVLMNWGFRSGTAGAEPEDITRRGALVPPKPALEPAAVPPPAPPAAPPAGRGCLGWLLPLLLLLLLLALLLSALGVVPSPLPAGCFRQDGQSRQAEDLRRASLDDEYARIMAGLAERAAMCRPAEPEEERVEREAVIPDFTPPEPEAEETKEEPTEVPFFGDPPVLTEPAPREETPKPAPKAEKPTQPKAETPKEQPKAEPAARETPKETPKAEKPKKNESMKIPKDAAQTNDLSFLEGCWKSETGLYNNHGEPIDAEYCFNKRGEGRRFVREPSGQRCSGKVTARFKGNQLSIDGAEAPCPNGREYVPQRIECEGSERSTQCRGHELGGRGNRWNHQFKRK